MKKVNKSKLIKMPATKQVLIVLALIVASGGSYGGYTVYKNSEMFGGSTCLAPMYAGEVLDGDTFEANSARIRLSEIDAPEKGECYFEESKAALEKLLLGQKITLTKDIEGVDNFGRLIRYVVIQNENDRVDNILANRWMVKNGFARYYNSENSLHQRELLSDESEARNANVGIWKDCKDEMATKDRLGKRVIEVSAEPTDPKCLIKGNVSDVGFGKVYVLPTCPNYKVTKIDVSKDEKYFCSEKEAEAAGFKKAEDCE